MFEERSYWSGVARRRVSRRGVLRGGAVGGIGLLATGLVGCGDDDDEAEPSAAATTATGQTPAASPTATPELPKAGGAVRTITTTLPPTFDAYANSSGGIQRPYGIFTNRILRYKTGPESTPNTLEIEPDVAAALPEQPDPTTVIVEIRSDVKFQNVAPVNGRAMKAEDVAYSVQRFKDMAANKALLSNMESVEVTDATHVKFKLKNGSASFVNGLANSIMVWILAPEASKEITNAGPFVGTGPFIYTKYEADVQWSFKKNPDYFEKGLPYVDTLDDVYIGQTPTQDANFRSGQVAYVLTTEEDRYDELSKVDGAVPGAFDSLSMRLGELALHVAPFDKPEVRRALSMAVDRNEIAAALGSIDFKWHNMTLPAGYRPFFIDPQGKDFGENAKYFKYDPAEAKKLLAAAGFDDKNPLSFPIQYTSFYDQEQTHYELIAAQLAEVGIKAELKNYEYTDYQNKFKVGPIDNRLYEGMLGNRPASSPDPMGWYQVYWLPSASRATQKFTDAELERRVAEQDLEFDSEKRLELNKDIQRYMAGMCYRIPTVSQAQGVVSQPWLKGFYYKSNAAVGVETFARMWVDKA